MRRLRDEMMKRVLVTGAAGFIGYHMTRRLLDEGYAVIGIDNINDYYDVTLKHSRLRQLHHDNFTFIQESLENRTRMANIFLEYSPSIVIHLAAQAGVRYSLKNPHSYIDSNIVGFMNILEACRHHKVEHLLYASSSSVYGSNTKLPFSTDDNVDHPISIYAATKKANELMAHSYSHLFGIRTTGLRFFTVYGPWGRPDMALFMFTKAILNGDPIQVFNHGDMSRDFTYVDDIIESIYRILIRDGKSTYKVYNIGNNAPVKLLDFVCAIEKKLNRQAEKQYLPLQAGDVPSTYADVNELIADIDYKPQTSIEEGVGHFIKWYKRYYGV
ncbi:NAD-dependent epimerase [Paenibacillus hexagrammi]|uniref:NAD-dependent epimerase n=1 Tax=Paenibacillus hexagrammi TaxID=2908839 RepID=A0ABY3SRB8_9BACL|nr:NAD-dependent epimerase [Paenibacillus sp. YPD9-1]UJF35536.1 NAD-dependent epimerase [Paenibacillus sp. YPD9-1]